MTHFEKYLVISYIFYMFILQKAVLFSQSRRVRFQKFSGPPAPTMVGPPKIVNHKISRFLNPQTCQLWFSRLFWKLKRQRWWWWWTRGVYLYRYHFHGTEVNYNYHYQSMGVLIYPLIYQAFSECQHHSFSDQDLEHLLECPQSFFS